MTLEDSIAERVYNKVSQARDKASHTEIRITGLPDSGQRREFESGAVRDMAEGKGRCDLLPLDVVSVLFQDQSVSGTLARIAIFQETGDPEYLQDALAEFINTYFDTSIGIGVGYSRKKTIANALIAVAQHFEAGAGKYGDNNWMQGIPVHVYIDSALRHYLKFIRGDQDEPHDRAVAWNLICAIWTCWHKPELNTYKQEVKP